MRNIEVRRAEKSDIDRLLELLYELFSIEVDFNFEEDVQRKGIELMLSDEDVRTILVGTVDGRIMGMCAAQIIVSTGEGGKSAWVEDVVVDTSQRGTGIGRKMLDELVKWAKSKGASRVQLLADRDNTPAIDFYKHTGWKETNLVCYWKRDV